MRLAEWLLFLSTSAHGLWLNTSISAQRHIRQNANLIGLISDRSHRSHRSKPHRSHHHHPVFPHRHTHHISLNDSSRQWAEPPLSVGAHASRPYFGDADPRSNRSRRSTICSKSSECSTSVGEICQDGECVSACSLKGLQKCRCPDDSDEECYLCCGSATKMCKPAHSNGIYRPNGEFWEHPTCEYCRRRGIRALGQMCSDKHKNNVCFDGKCTGALCAAAPEGQYCIQQGSTNRICASGRCVDPCAEAGLHMCECSIASIYRCELCCVDSQGKCQSAKEMLRITKGNGDPYPRYGLTCGRYDWTCNALAQCRGCPRYASPLNLALCLLLPTVLLRR